MSVRGQCFPACPLAYIFIWKLVFRGLIFLRFCNDSNEIRYDWLSEVVNFYFSEKIKKIVKRLIFFLQILSNNFVSGNLIFVYLCVGVKGVKRNELQAKCVQNVSCECCLPCQKEKKTKSVQHGRRNSQIKKTGMFVKNFVIDF